MDTSLIRLTLVTVHLVKPVFCDCHVDVLNFPHCDAPLVVIGTNNECSRNDTEWCVTSAKKVCAFPKFMACDSPESTTIQTSTSLTTAAPSSYTTISPVSLADTCICSYDTRRDYWLQFHYGNFTQQEKNEMVEAEKRRIKRELTVPKNNLSSYRRTKTSAGDDRKSSRSMGFLGVILITSVMLLIIMADMSNAGSCCGENVNKRKTKNYSKKATKNDVGLNHLRNSY